MLRHEKRLNLKKIFFEQQLISYKCSLPYFQNKDKGEEYHRQKKKKEEQFQNPSQYTSNQSNLKEEKIRILNKRPTNPI